MADAIASLVQGFLAHEEACSRTLAEALELAERPANERLRITQFNDVLNELGERIHSQALWRASEWQLWPIDQLLEEAGQLESSITAISPRQAECIVQLSDRPEQGSRLIATLSALLPVLRTRAANLECARAVTQSGKAILRLVMKTQSLHNAV